MFDFDPIRCTFDPETCPIVPEMRERCAFEKGIESIDPDASKRAKAFETFVDLCSRGVCPPRVPELAAEGLARIQAKRQQTGEES